MLLPGARGLLGHEVQNPRGLLQTRKQDDHVTSFECAPGYSTRAHRCVDYQVVSFSHFFKATLIYSAVGAAHLNVIVPEFLKNIMI